MVQQRKHVFVVGYITLFSGLMSMFAFDTLQIPSGCIAPICIPLATGLAKELLCLTGWKISIFNARNRSQNAQYWK